MPRGAPAVGLRDTVGAAHVAALARRDPAAAGEGAGARKSRCKSRAGCDVIIKMI